MNSRVFLAIVVILFSVSVATAVYASFPHSAISSGESVLGSAARYKETVASVPTIFAGTLGDPNKSVPWSSFLSTPTYEYGANPNEPYKSTNPNLVAAAENKAYSGTNYGQLDESVFGSQYAGSTKKSVIESGESVFGSATKYKETVATPHTNPYMFGYAGSLTNLPQFTNMPGLKKAAIGIWATD